MKLSITKKLLSTFLLFTFILQSPRFVYGWGAYGHRMIAAIAEKVIQPETKKKIEKLLEERSSLEEISNWADEVRWKRRRTAKWHYVNIPKNRNIYDPHLDCPKGGCLVSKIEDFTKTLAVPSAKQEEREEALKYLVHFTGDLHQPLHCGYREDRGGNNVKVKFAGRKTNLHEVWDTLILARDIMKFENYVDKLTKRLSPQDIEKMQEGSIFDWLSESRSILQNHVYNFNTDGFLDSSYLDHSLMMIDEQLLKAGVRLAGILDATLNNPN